MFDEQENQSIEETINNEAEISNEEVVQHQENSPQKNFRELRQKMERMQRERDEALNYIKNIEAKATASNYNNPVDDEDFSLDPDAIAEGKHISRVNNKIKKLEEQIKSYQQQSHESVTEAKLKSKYADFDKVVSQDNVEALRKSHPEIWATINSTSDLYNKAVSAYTLIKELRLSPDDSYDADKIAVQKNVSKPRPLTSVSPQQGDSPLSRANAFAGGLTDDLKDQLRKEMELARRSM